MAAIAALTVWLAGCAIDPTRSDEYRSLEARLLGVQAERDAILGELYAMNGEEPAKREGEAGAAGYLPLITIEPVEWGITLDQVEPGVHLVSMIVDARPTVVDDVGEVAGRLVWDDVEVALCGISIREIGDRFVRVGDIYGTDEGCGGNPAAMQAAFDRYGLAEKGCLAISFTDFEIEYCAPVAPLTLTPVEWEIVLDNLDEGVHTVHMIVDVRPLTADRVQGISARMVWEEVEVDLCGFNWDVGAGFLLIGDIFQTNEGCFQGDTAMRDAIDSHGLPATACVVVTVGSVDHEYCAPLATNR